MRDHKKASSGDDCEISQQSAENKSEIVTSEYLIWLIHGLEAFTGKTLNEEEMVFWMQRLSKFPKWKLKRFTDYTGGMNNDFFKFLEGLRSHESEKPEYLALPAPRSDICKLCTAHVRIMMSDISNDEKDRIELEFVSAMKEKFPRGMWKCGRRANR